MNFLKYLLSIFLIIFTVNSYSENTKKSNEIYKIEIIVFSNGNTAENLYSSFDKIEFPKKINRLKEEAITINEDLADINTESEANNSPKLYTKINSENFSLKTISNKLNSSPKYKLISHYAWYQDLNNKSGAYLNGGKNYYENEKNSAETDIISGNGDFYENFKIDFSSNSVDNNYFKFLNPEWELEGFIELQKFTRSKIHVNMNLLVNTPMNMGNHLHYKTFTVKQNINVSLNETVYFDNPYFGAILYISKFNSNQT